MGNFLFVHVLPCNTFPALQWLLPPTLDGIRYSKQDEPVYKSQQQHLLNACSVANSYFLSICILIFMTDE